MKAVANLRNSDSGLTLVELAIYVIILGIFSAVVAAFVLSAFRSEQAVSGITSSTSDSQNTVLILQKDIRNARQFDVSPDGRTLTASVVGAEASPTWQCVSWEVNGAGDKQWISRNTRSDASSSEWSGAARLLGGVYEVDSSTDIFSGSAALGAEGTLTYALEVSTTDNGVIDVAGSVSTLGQTGDGSSDCF